MKILKANLPELLGMVIVLDMSPLFLKFDRSRRVDIHNEHEHTINVVFLVNLYAKRIKSCFVQFAIKKTCKTRL